jgi:hypothetical protein
LTPAHSAFDFTVRAKLILRKRVVGVNDTLGKAKTSFLKSQSMPAATHQDHISRYGNAYRLFETLGFLHKKWPTLFERRCGLLSQTSCSTCLSGDAAKMYFSHSRNLFRITSK